MLKNITQLKAIVAEKEGLFLCDMDTPLQAVKEMLFQFQKFVGQIEDQIATQAKAQAEASLPVSDEVKEETKIE